MIEHPYEWNDSFRPIKEDATRQKLADEYRNLRLKFSARTLLPLAKGGERWAALHLVELCAESVRDNCRITGDVAEWLSHALLHIARGDTIEQALAIPPRGKGKAKEGRASVESGRRISLAYQAACVMLVDKQKQLYAFSKVGDDNGVDGETVKKAWQEFRVTVEREIRLQQEHLGKVFRI